ncbi:MAG: hypothetical protein WC666_03700 [Candidatus Paceibacterota bacterium]|jgi:hypothetical protein
MHPQIIDNLTDETLRNIAEIREEPLENGILIVVPSVSDKKIVDQLISEILQAQRDFEESQKDLATVVFKGYTPHH